MILSLSLLFPELTPQVQDVWCLVFVLLPSGATNVSALVFTFIAPITVIHIMSSLFPARYPASPDLGAVRNLPFIAFAVVMIGFDPVGRW